MLLDYLHAPRYKLFYALIPRCCCFVKDGRFYAIFNQAFPEPMLARRQRDGPISWTSSCCCRCSRCRPARFLTNGTAVGDGLDSLGSGSTPETPRLRLSTASRSVALHYLADLGLHLLHDLSRGCTTYYRTIADKGKHQTGTDRAACGVRTSIGCLQKLYVKIVKLWFNELFYLLETQRKP